MTPKRRTEGTQGASEPPELAPVEQSLRAKIKAMSIEQLEALGVAIELEYDQRRNDVD